MMFWHPLFLSIISTDIVALLLLLAVARTSFRTALYWQPNAADSRQLILEAAVENASVQGRAAFWLFLFAAILLVFGIANVFQENIPGAMCGTGVCQAMAGGGPKLFLYTGLLLLLMHLWYNLDKLNRSQVDMPLTESNARLFLVILPVAFLTLIQTYTAFANIQPYRPVDCCAIVYDQFKTLKHANSIFGLQDPWWIGSFIALSLALLGLGVAMGFTTAAPGNLRLTLAGISGLWLPVTALTLVNVLSAYHYEVLHHHCPWCLFLSEHGLVGYPLYGTMGVIGMEAFTMLGLPPMAGRHAFTLGQAVPRCRRGARRIIIAEMIFLIFAVGPALVWRLRFGTWLV